MSNTLCTHPTIGSAIIEVEPPSGWGDGVWVGRTSGWLDRLGCPPTGPARRVVHPGGPESRCHNPLRRCDMVGRKSTSTKDPSSHDWHRWWDFLIQRSQKVRLSEKQIKRLFRLDRGTLFKGEYDLTIQGKRPLLNATSILRLSKVQTCINVQKLTSIKDSYINRQ